MIKINTLRSLSILLFVSITTILASSQYYSYRQFSEAAYADFERQTVQLVSGLERSFMFALATGHRATIRQMATEVIENNNLIYHIEIKDSEQDVVASIYDKTIPTNHGISPQPEFLLKDRRPNIFDLDDDSEVILGSINLTLSNHYTQEKINNAIGSHIAIFAIAILLVLIAIVWLNRKTAQFIRKTEKTLTSITSGAQPEPIDGIGIHEFDKIEQELFRLWSIHSKQTADKELLQAQKKRLMDSVSTDLKSRTKTITGLLDIIKPQLREYEIPPEIEGMISLVENEAKTINAQLDQLIDFEGLEQDHHVYQENAFYPNELINKIDAIYSQKHTPRLRFEVSADENSSLGDLLAITDEEKLYKVLSCVLDNSFDNTTAGTIALSWKATRTRLSFCLNDTGAGFRENEHKHIFDDSQAAKLGMGLSMVKKFVGLLRGEIDIESTENVGTTINISIPIKTMTADKQAPIITSRAINTNIVTLSGDNFEP
ncbi:hypothetical protein A9Q81_11860 [Gammaproteobacteria bacterium 42_54_T18]|nr:hypothetical protein A9Q81_11860 [Gammaproteobacteria bacterium 42_54_T18]